jgi:hypothetical protein
MGLHDRDSLRDRVSEEDERKLDRAGHRRDVGAASARQQARLRRLILMGLLALVLLLILALLTARTATP